MKPTHPTSLDRPYLLESDQMNTKSSVVPEYWRSRETVIEDLDSFYALIQKISKIQAASPGAPNLLDTMAPKYVWRGVTCADWGLFSSLARNVNDALDRPATEMDVQEDEAIVLQQAKEWSLDWHPNGGRLTSLELLARLQHHGAPTRLLDFTYSPFIALWFAVQEIEPKLTDGRVFACDIAHAEHLNSDPLPWRNSTNLNSSPWNKNFYVVTPPPLDDRIIRQSGLFLTGGIPEAPGLSEVMSVTLDVKVYDDVVSNKVRRGQSPSTFAIRIPAAQKQNIKQALADLHNISYKTVYPDLQGFSDWLNGQSYPLKDSLSIPWVDRRLQGQ